jgi:hypothetical protein
MKKTYHFSLHLHHRVAQPALRLRCVRSICCGALLKTKIYCTFWRHTRRKYFIQPVWVFVPIAVVARSKAWVCGRWFARSVGSNPAGNMDVCLLRVLCVARQRSLRLADHSSRAVLPNECNREASKKGEIKFHPGM